MTSHYCLAQRAAPRFKCKTASAWIIAAATVTAAAVVVLVVRNGHDTRVENYKLKCIVCYSEILSVRNVQLRI